MAEEVISNIYQFKITMKHITPKIWRKIQVPENFSFSQLHSAIQMAMGWRNAHLHKFEMNKKIIIEPFEDELQDKRDVDESGTFIKDWFKNPKDKAVYEYDFGDSWLHIVELEKIEPAKPGEKYPKCLSGRRACPPEDCGGPYGYEELLHILTTPSNEYHDERKEWMEEMGYENFDPEQFSAAKVFDLWKY